MRSKSFRSSLFISFLMLALIVLAVSSGFLISAVEKKIEYDYYKECNLLLDNTDALLAEYLDEMQDVIREISSDEQIVSALHETDSWLLKKAYNRFYSLTQEQREHATFYLYDEEGREVLSTSPVERTENQAVYWGIFKEAYTHSDRVAIRNAEYEVKRDDAAVCLAKAIVIDDEIQGFLLADISDSDIEELLKTIPGSSHEMMILDRFGDTVFCSDVNMTEHLQGEGYLFYSREMENYDFALVTGGRDVFSSGLKRTMAIVIIAMALVSFLLSFVVARVLSNQLMSPVNDMTEAMAKVREGDLTAQINSLRADEFGQLSRDFDDMTRALKIYVDLRSKQQQELSESNIAMMQAQLNPHFLYNTLDSIKWIAKANHVPELAVMSSSLAKILRYSISPETFVPLDSEIKLVDYYIQIQKIRFPGDFSYDAEVPIELEDVIVPKLILQPIVENAIVHGLKDREDGYIFLNAYEQEDRLIIDIEDDGCGMNEEMLETLNEQRAEKLKGHLGFYNVATIIKLHYGLNYGVHAANLSEGGVRVTIELPIKRGDENAESTGD